MFAHEARAKYGRDSLKAILCVRFPIVAKCQMAAQTIRSDGRADRFVFLYDGKSQHAKIIGRCHPSTMAAFTAAGLFQYQTPIFSTGDTAQQTWWRKDLDD